MYLATVFSVCWRDCHATGQISSDLMVLKWRTGERLVIRRRYETALTGSRQVSSDSAAAATVIEILAGHDLDDELAKARIARFELN
jgi:hypothetical protein